MSEYGLVCQVCSLKALRMDWDVQVGQDISLSLYVNEIIFYDTFTCIKGEMISNHNK